MYGDVYMLDDDMKWKVLPSMPKPDSHIEFAWVMVNNSIVIAGGTTDKHPETKKMVLNGELFQFNLNTMVTIFSFWIIRNFSSPYQKDCHVYEFASGVVVLLSISLYVIPVVLFPFLSHCIEFLLAGRNGRSLENFHSG